MEWYERWGGQVYVAFSGGKDSTVLLDLARRVHPSIPAVFSDTGLEFPEIREFVKTKSNVQVVRPSMPFHKVIQTYGYPVIGKQQARFIRDLQNANGQNDATVNLRLTGFNRNGDYCPSMKLANKWVYLKDAPFAISEQCCDVMKKKPLSEYGKRTGRHPITGTMCEESGMRKRIWLMQGCNAFDAKEPISQPMSFWTEQDVLRYVLIFLQPEVDTAWENVAFTHGSIRKKARKYLRKNHYSKSAIASVYGEIVEDKDGVLHTTGEQRTGCMFCMFGCHLEK